MRFFLQGGNINMYIPGKQVHDCGKFIYLFIVFPVPKNLRKIDEGEVASECIISFVGNGQCDWQIQNNPHGQCDYDRKDCR